MDFRIVDSHKSMKLDSSNHLYIVLRPIDVSIQHMDFQANLAYKCTLVDGFVLRSVHFQRMNQHHRPYDTHDSIDRKLHHLNNLHCTGKFRVRKISTGCLVFRPDKYSWLDDFVPSIQLLVRIEFHRTYRD